MVKAFKKWGKHDRSYPLVCFSSKIWKNILSLIMMKTIRVRLKMEFLHYNCFPAITKLIARLHYTLPNPEQMLWSYWKTDILKLDIVILRAQYQKNVLKYDKNIYADIETIWKYLGTLPVEIYYNTMHLKVLMQLCKIGKTCWFKDVFEKSSCLGLVFMLRRYWRFLGIYSNCCLWRKYLWMLYWDKNIPTWLSKNYKFHDTTYWSLFNTQAILWVHYQC